MKQMRQITAYVLKETLPLYLAGFSIFMVLMTTDMLASYMGWIMQFDVSFWAGFELFFLKTPQFMSMALSAAIPFAILMTFGRLARDSELKVMLSSGIRPIQLMVPMLALGASVVPVLLWVEHQLKPMANLQHEETYYRLSGLPARVQQEEMYTQVHKGILYTAGSVRRQTDDLAVLKGVMVRTEHHTFTAPSGTWDVKKGTWSLYDVKQVNHNTGTWEPRISMDFPSPAAQPNFTEKSSFIPSGALQKRMHDPELPLAEQRKSQMEWGRRFADPFTALSFALAASALGLLLRDRSWAFILVVLMVFGYYVLWIRTPDLAEVGALPVWLAVWLPNGVFAALGLAVLRRLL